MYVRDMINTDSYFNNINVKLMLSFEKNEF